MSTFLNSYFDLISAIIVTKISLAWSRFAVFKINHRSIQFDCFLAESFKFVKNETRLRYFEHIRQFEAFVKIPFCFLYDGILNH